MWSRRPYQHPHAQVFERKIVNISYPSVLTYVLSAQKNRLIETVLFSIHYICFGWEIRFVCYASLTKGMHTTTIKFHAGGQDFVSHYLY